jgi:tetratricopeptide (TPR) repeat protein
MKVVLHLIVLLAVLVLAPAHAAQSGTAPSAAVVAAEKAFLEGNELMEKGKFAEAHQRYVEGLKHLPDDPSLLYNASTAAVRSGNYAAASVHLKKLVAAFPDDWQARAKLIQTHQALGDLKARDDERAALFALRKRGGGRDTDDPKVSLSQQEMYCRERFEAGGRQVMAFEHFELKGPRGRRYVFIVLEASGEKEDYNISLGSYDLTNSIWAAQNKDEAAKGGRLFHLDGYYNWGHATFGMYYPEPSYDDVRKIVVQILESKKKPVSSSTVVRPAPPEPKKP